MRYAGSSPRAWFLDSRLRLVLHLFLVLCLLFTSLATTLAPAAAGGGVFAERGEDGTTAQVSWAKYAGDDFSYYRVIVCTDAQYDGASCSGTVFQSEAIWDAGNTGPVTVTGLDPYTGYGVILQTWHREESAVIKLHDTMPALPEPTPEPTPTPTPEPTPTPTPEPTPTPTPTPEPTQQDGEQEEGLASAQGGQIQAGLSWVSTPQHQNWQQGTAVNVTLPAATGADHIVYTLTNSGDSKNLTLPPGLSWNGSTRTISGTPTSDFSKRVFVYNAAATNKGTHSNLRFQVADTNGNYPPYRNIKSNSAQLLAQLWSHYDTNPGMSCYSGTITFAPSSGHSVHFVDDDGDTMTFTAGTSDMVSTTINSSGYAVMTLKHPPLDWYYVHYTATDPSGLTDSIQLGVKSMKCTHSLSIQENKPKDTVVGSVGGSNPGGSSFTLNGDANTYFDIDSTNGQITVKDGTTLDYETKTNYTGNFRYTVAGKTAGGDIRINVNDVRAPNVDRPTLAQNATNPTTALDVSWTAPTPMTGTTLNDYDVRYREWGTSSWTEMPDTTNSLATSTTITGLTAGKEYEVQVRSQIADEGPGHWSGSSVILYLAENTAVNGNVGGKFNVNATDYYPLSFTLGGTDGSKFKLSTDTGYKTAQSAQIQVKTGNVPDFETKSSYSLTLRAVENNLNRNILDVTYSVLVIVTDVSEPPGKPTVTVAKNSTTPASKIDVSWTAPTMTGKPAISDYDVQYRKTGDSNWSSHSFTGTGTSTTLTGLTAGKKYDVQVRAVNAEGNGSWSDTGNAITTSSAVTRSVAENSAANANVGAAVTMTAGSYTLAHSLSGTDAGKFEIGSTTGQITVKSGTSLDYESGATSYSVTVSIAVTGTGNSNSAPNGTGTYTVPVTINVTDVAEPPAAPSAPTVAKNSTTPTTKLDVSWTAPTMTGKPAISDYDVQYRKVGDSTWIDASFTGTGTSTTLTGLTSGKTYEVQVRATNDEGDSAWSNSGTAITDAAGVTRSIAENSAAGTNVGAAVTAKANSSYTYTHSLDGTDKDKFTIESSSGQIKVKTGNVPNYEAKTSYSVTVKIAVAAKSQGGANAQSLDPNAPGNYVIPVTINVTDVNEPPAAPGAPTVSAHATSPKYKLEVSWTAPTMTGKPAITDYDVQYKKSSDSTWTTHSFTGTGTSTTLTGLTSGTTYDVQVKAKNDEGNSGWSASGSKKTKANTAPVIPATATRSIDENSAANASIGAVVSATDADGDTLTYSLTGTDASDFTIDSATGQIKVKSALDYEDDTSYTVTVNVTDGKDDQEGTDNTVDDTTAVTINVNDVNEPPAKPDAPAVVQNTATPKTKLDVSWTAPDMTGKPAISDYDVQYKKTSDSTWTDASFTGTTTSTTLTGLTEGTGYEVQVKAINDEGNSGWSLSGSSNTQDKNVHADFPDLTATRSIDENSAAGSNVGAAVTANDTEGHTLYYTLNGTDKDEFDIGLNTGQITVKDGKVPNYEAKTSYSVTVEVSDRKDTDDNPDTKIDDTITVTINVNDVNEPPAAPSVTVSTNATAPTSKIDVSWTAPDMTGKPALSDYDVQYRKTGDSTWSSHSFTGTGTSTTLTGLTSGKSYDVQVRGVNAEGNGAWASGSTITRADAVTRDVKENSEAGANVGAAVTATSNPNSYTLTHSLSGADASKFEIGSSTGQITVKSGTDLDYETKTSYSVTVTVTAALAGVSSQSFSLNPNAPGGYVIPVTINVTDVNEPPEFPADTVIRSIAENSVTGTNVGLVVTASDQDGDTLTYSLTGTDANDFTIDSASGQIKVKSALDYEGDASYSVTVQVTDNKKADGTADTKIDDTITVTVNVLDVNEPPTAPDGPTVSQNADSPTNSLDVSWTAPDMTGKPAIDDYDLQYKKKGESDWTAYAFSGVSTSTTITGLDKGSEYYVQVKAKNHEGESGWSTTGRAITQIHEKASMQVPENTPAGTPVTGALPAVDDHGHTLTYAITGDVIVDGAQASQSQQGHTEFTINPATGQVSVSQGADLNYESTHTHQITITASHQEPGLPNDIINAVFTVTVTVGDVSEPPAAPAAPTVARNADRPKTELDVSWTAPDMTGKPAITDYDVQYKKTPRLVLGESQLHRDGDQHHHNGPDTRQDLPGAGEGDQRRGHQRLVRPRHGHHQEAASAAHADADAHTYPDPAAAGVHLRAPGVLAASSHGHACAGHAGAPGGGRADADAHADGHAGPDAYACAGRVPGLQSTASDAPAARDRRRRSGPAGALDGGR